jgi:GNAT superfamily N-acetyltransferase
MMDYHQNSFRIGAYNPQIKKMVDALNSLKIKLNPYIIFLEELSDNIASPQIDNEFNKYRILFLGPDDMEVIATLPERRPTEADLLSRLKEDKICIAIKLAQKIIAFTWYDLKECNIKGVRCLLKENEAYLFDAYTLPSYRGKGIAPFMRYRSYQELNNLCKYRLLSFSDYYNTPAIRFKEKLKAKPLELHLQCILEESILTCG